jgi:hypothetical protein
MPGQRENKAVSRIGCVQSEDGQCDVVFRDGVLRSN